MSEALLTRDKTEGEWVEWPEDDGIDRFVIEGELIEEPMSERNPFHSQLCSRLSYELEAWLRSQPQPHGRVLTGDAAFRLRKSPLTRVGIDVALISAALAATIKPRASFVDGIPILAVEILSPSDKQESITKKVREYLDVGVALVWIVEPVFCTITIYRPDALPRMVNTGERLTGDGHLGGFDVAVADIFSP